MNILITGGTGSLGEALTEKLLSLRWPTKICIYSRGEHRQEQMRAKFNSEKLRFFIGDIRDKDRLSLACENIQIIVHAAALKVVPVAEYNPFEAINTNVLGAQNLVSAVLKNQNGIYPKVLAISTDKAVHPINLYGATKLCAEKIFLAANNIRGQHGPRFSVARYGNVANSNGSVIPLFRKQVANNEQLTITHDSMTRFWITLDEATTFIIRCLDRMYGGEVFVPDMPRMSVKALALAMMKEYPPDRQWCKVIGIRPGEKLHEEIITPEESGNCIYDKLTKTYIINPPQQVRLDTLHYEDMVYAGVASNSEYVREMSQEEIGQKVKEL